ncbi:Regulatory phage protein cox [compost metagenome]
MMSESEMLQSITLIDKKVNEEKGQKKLVGLSPVPSELLSKEGFALYVGKTTTAVVAMAKAGKLPAFYMADPSKPGGLAELWIHKGEWDKYARQLVDSAPEEWHDWKNRISANKTRRHHAA